MYIQMKDGDEILQGKSLGLERLHAAVMGTNIEGMLHYCSNLTIFTYLLFIQMHIELYLVYWPWSKFFHPW